jgi:hypothetical protein
MPDEEICAVCRTLREWETRWDSAKTGSPPSNPGAFREVAHYVGGVLSTSGFRLFENGGTPLAERHTGPYREEVIFCPAPRMARRPDLPFSVRIHLSSSAIARVRSRFWRPPTRAPVVVARGDLGQLCDPERRIIWFASGQVATAQRIAEELNRWALPWFACFKDPRKMRAKLYTRDLQWIEPCTALELLLSEFDPFEARTYRRLMIERENPKSVVTEPSGFELTEDRFAPITTYYRL